LAIAWLHAGDICNGWDKEVMAAAQAAGREPRIWEEPIDAAVEAWFGARSLPVFAVRGNHDVVDPYRAFLRASDITGGLVLVAEGLYVAGVGWCGQYHFDLPLENELEPVCKAVCSQAQRRLGTRDRLVLLTHYPAKPDGQIEGTASYDCVRRLVEELTPLVVIQGHIHQWFGTSTTLQLNGHQVLFPNPGPNGAEIEIDMELGVARLLRYFDPDPRFQSQE